MNDVCFVFPSTAEKDANKIIDRYLKGVEYDVKFLNSTGKEKILKKDIDLDMSELDGYKIKVCVGAESLKYVAGMTGVQKYNGVFLEKKYEGVYVMTHTSVSPHYLICAMPCRFPAIAGAWVCLWTL